MVSTFPNHKVRAHSSACGVPAQVSLSNTLNIYGNFVIDSSVSSVSFEYMQPGYSDKDKVKH